MRTWAAPRSVSWFDRLTMSRWALAQGLGPSCRSGCQQRASSGAPFALTGGVRCERLGLNFHSNRSATITSSVEDSKGRSLLGQNSEGKTDLAVGRGRIRTSPAFARSLTFCSKRSATEASSGGFQGASPLENKSLRGNRSGDRPLTCPNVACFPPKPDLLSRSAQPTLHPVEGSKGRSPSRINRLGETDLAIDR
jgi:hypothetical protein